MVLDGNTVLYLLSREFGEVEGRVPARGPLVDYPVFHDAHVDMGGHVVLVPSCQQLEERPLPQNSVCVCIDRDVFDAAVEAGTPAVLVRGEPSVQHLYNRMMFLFVRNERLDTKLHAYVEAHAGFQALLDACAQTLNCSCALYDDRFQLVCEALYAGADASAAGMGQLGGYVDDDLVDALMASRGYRRMRQTRNVYAVPESDNLFMKNVFAGEKMVGTLVIAHGGDVMAARFARYLLGYLGQFVEDMYERMGTFETPTSGAQRMRDELERAFRGQPIDAAAVDRMLASEQDGTPGRYVVLRFERSFTHEGPKGLDYVARRIERSWRRVHCVTMDGGLFALACLDAPGRSQQGDFLQDMTVFARDMLMKVGMSRPFDSSAQIACARLQATAALEQGDIQNPMRWFHRFDDGALAWLVSHGQGDLPADFVEHLAVSQLRSYDQEHGTDLLHTLQVFMQCRYNATDAAKSLFVARSTLLNRLARIEELTHVDLDSFAERIYLGVSLEVLK